MSKMNKSGVLSLNSNRVKLMGC